MPNTPKREDFKSPIYPAIFLRAATTLIGAKEAITLPRSSETLDYEAELAVVIGKRGRYIEPNDALSYVAGYSSSTTPRYANIRGY
jgi:acylpyruvate hydrolase